MPPFNQTQLTIYTRKFTKLKQGGTPYGKAPHKPIFLLTLIELIEKQLITENRVTITPELVATFKENFSLLVQTAHKDDFTQPFFLSAIRRVLVSKAQGNRANRGLYP